MWSRMYLNLSTIMISELISYQVHDETHVKKRVRWLDSRLGSYGKATAAQWNYRAELCKHSSYVRYVWPPFRRNGRISIFPPSTPPNTIIRQGCLDSDEYNVRGRYRQASNPPPPPYSHSPRYGVHCSTCSC
jgi:hypothetical protein